ncbi:hypothetical protein ACPA54_13325 [Uniformispora flossi]|uniref:hypothetical protein n=1 Tax=Uniformispora flossi TaxID=3390723 RepID=UPI003C30B4CF
MNGTPDDRAAEAAEERPATPVELLLAAALKERAELVAPGALRPPAPPAAADDGACAARRRLRTVRRAGLPLLVAASVAAVVVGTATSAGPAHPGPSPSRVVAASPSDTPTPPVQPPASTAAAQGPSAAPEGPAPEGRTAGIDGEVTVRVPDGWTVTGPSGPRDNRRICVRPPTNRTVDGCSPGGVTISLHKKAWPNAEAIDADDGWHDDAIAPYCYAAGSVGPMSHPRSQKIVTSESRPVAGRTAAFRAWEVGCGGGTTFTTRVWWIADLPLTVNTDGLDARYDAAVEALVASLRVTDD